MITCYYSWDTFFDTFEEYFQKIDRVVPMILSVGNHDVGFNSLADVDIEINEDGPFYFVYLP